MYTHKHMYLNIWNKNIFGNNSKYIQWRKTRESEIYKVLAIIQTFTREIKVFLNNNKKYTRQSTGLTDQTVVKGRGTRQKLFQRFQFE